MKLIASTLTGVYQQTEELRRLEAVTQHNEVLQELDELGKQIKGCTQLINELCLARESLKAAGYSGEWMDIINKDNNFLAVVDLDMPKFFGGDEAKQAACEGAIIDTIKKWCKAVWEWIKKFFATIKKALYWVKGLWVHEGRNQGAVLETYQKVKKLAEDSKDPKVQAALKVCFADLTLADPDVLMNHIKSYRALMEVCHEIAIQLDSRDAKNISDGGLQKIMMDWEVSKHCFEQLLMERWGKGKSVVPPRDKLPTEQHNGFTFSGTDGDSIKFSPTIGEAGCPIPKFEMGYSQFDAPKQAYYFEHTALVSNEAFRLSDDLNKTISDIERRKAGIERLKNQVLASNLASDDSDEIKGMASAINLYVKVLMCIQRVATNCIKISGRVDSDMRKAYTEFERLQKNLSAEQA